MQEELVKKLVRIKTLLMVAMFLLVLAELSFILSQVFNYILAIIGAVLVLAIRIAFYIFRDNNAGLQQKILLVVAIIGVFGPIIYYIYKGIFVDPSSFWIMLFLSVSFLTPVAIMYYINTMLTKLIAEPAPKQ